MVALMTGGRAGETSPPQAMQVRLRNRDPHDPAEGAGLGREGGGTFDMDKQDQQMSAVPADPS